MEYLLELNKILLLNFQSMMESGLESISHENLIFLVKLSTAIIECNV